MSNSKSALQERLAMYQPRIDYMETRGADQRFSSTVTVTFTYQGVTRVLSQSSVSTHLAKKEAQFDAASVMLNSEELIRALTNQTVGPASSVSGPDSKTTLNLLSMRFGVTVNYNTSEAAPFITVVTVPHPDSPWENTSITGQPAGTRKEAEQSAAGLALADPQVMAMFGLALPSEDASPPTFTSPAPTTLSPSVAPASLAEVVMVQAGPQMQLPSTVAAVPILEPPDYSPPTGLSIPQPLTPISSSPGSVSTLTAASAVTSGAPTPLPGVSSPLVRVQGTLVGVPASNPKGWLLERFMQAGFMQPGLLQHVPKFATTPTAPFVSTVTVALPSGEAIVLRGPDAPNKKQAEQAVAAMALQDPRIRQLLRFGDPPLTVASAPAGVADPPVPSVASLDDRPQGTPNGATVPNPKGWLLERFMQAGFMQPGLLQHAPKFATTPTAPFISTVTVALPSGETIVLTGPDAPNKKEAEQAAAAMAIQDPCIRQLLRLDPPPVRAPAPVHRSLFAAAPPSATAVSAPSMAPLPAAAEALPAQDVMRTVGARVQGNIHSDVNAAPDYNHRGVPAIGDTLLAPLAAVVEAPVSAVAMGHVSPPGATSTTTDSPVTSTATVADTHPHPPVGRSSVQEPPGTPTVPAAVPQLGSPEYARAASKDVPTPPSPSPAPPALSLPESGLAPAMSHLQPPAATATSESSTDATAPAVGAAAEVDLLGTSTTQPSTPISPSPGVVSPLTVASAPAGVADPPVPGVASLYDRPQGTPNGATVPNPKGWLLERFMQAGFMQPGLQQHVPKFATTPTAPFISKVTVALPSGEAIVLRGPDAPNKKQAEQAVAAMALQDPRIRQLLRLEPPPALVPVLASTQQQVWPTMSPELGVASMGASASLVEQVTPVAPSALPATPSKHPPQLGPAEAPPIASSAGAPTRSATGGVNYKGKLLEYCDRLNNIVACQPEFLTTTQAPCQFQCTFDLNAVGVRLTGPSRSTKKAAEQAVAELVLGDAHAREALRIARRAAVIGPSSVASPLGSAGSQVANKAALVRQTETTPTVAAATTIPTSIAPQPAAASAAAAPPVVVTSGDHDCVACRDCQAMLGQADHFFLYLISETEVQLVVKPEVAARVFGGISSAATAAVPTSEGLSVPALRMQPQRQSESPAPDTGSEATSEGGSVSAKAEKERILCGQCSTGVGVKMTTGPNNGTVYSLGVEKVTVNRQVAKSWVQARDDGVLAAFERRDGGTFYGTEADTPSKPLRAQNTRPVCFPQCEQDKTCEDSRDFRVVDLLSSSCIAVGKKPKPDQLRAFHLALQDNLIVVFPTGFGKTFVASLVMHRFRKLNPSKLVVMVVDRVPLVQQQSEAIHKDTGMVVCPLSGENNTTKVVENVIRGVYDALVVTAGALYHLMAVNQLYISDFSAIILDECHHVTGVHNYSKLLADVAKCPIAVRPRVVGLTASPFNIKGTNEASAGDKLADLRDAFFGAQVYRPSGIGSAFNGVEAQVVQLSTEQRAEQQRLTVLLEPQVQSLLQLFRKHKPVQYKALGQLCMAPTGLSETEHKIYWKSAENLGSDRHHRPSDPPRLVTMARAVRLGVYSLEANFLLGPAFSGSSRRVDWEEDDDTVSELSFDGSSADHPTAQLSSQLVKLCQLLSVSTASKTLVFVGTRYTAETLHRYLSLRFPELNCAKLIGQGGIEGMKWRGLEGQGAVLQRFREGATKLIVCTSVLEEGLDVKDCDLVIRFGGAPSLIQLIQSKGRARAESGRLVLICTAEERRHFEELKVKEQIVDRVLTNSAALASAPASAQFEKFVQRSTEELQELALRDPVDRDADESGDEGETLESGSQQRKATTYGEIADREARNGECGYPLTLIVQAAAGKRPSKDDIERDIPISLLSLPGTVLNVDRFHRVAQQSSMDPRAVSSQDTTVITSVTSKCEDFWWQFCGTWDFSVRSHSTFLLSPFTTVRKQDSEVVTAKAESVFTEVVNVAAGHLIGPQQFQSAGPLGAADGAAGHKYDRLVVHHGKRLCLESADTTGAVVTIALSTAILGRSALASAQGGTVGTFTVYFTMSSVPAVYQCPASQKRSTNEGGMSQYRVYSLESLSASGNDTELSETPTQRDLRLLAHCPVIAVTFRAVKWRRVLRKLTDPDVLGLNVVITRVAMLAEGQTVSSSLPVIVSEVTETPAQDGADSAELSAARRKCLWEYATLSTDVHTLALNPVTLPQIKFTVMTQLQSGDAAVIGACAQAIQSLHSLLLQGTHWLDAAALFETLLHSTPAGSSADCTVDDAKEGALTSVVQPTPPETLSDEYAYVNHVTVTPSRVIIQPATLTKTNRLIRMYGQRHVLVYARFRDEQGQPIYAKHIFEQRYQRMFAAGLDIAGRHYEFLLCSASQLREATAVFLEGSYDDVQAIRSTLISADLGSIPKQLSRMGLFCTADSDTGMQLRSDNMTVEPDLYCTDPTGKRRILTDGSGRMTPTFARQVQREFYQQHGYYGTLIQIRALGCKGTLLCDPTLPCSYPGKDVVFRESMRKFDTDCHTTLCLVKVAEFCPLTLNRESITLLCALRDGVRAEQRQWSPHNTLVALQDEALDRLGQMLISPTHAIDRLNAILPRKDLQALLESGGDILTEPHFRDLLHLMYAHDSRRLRQKTHIPVHHAALAMGAPDPTGLLKDGEVFLCVHRPVHGYAGCFNDAGVYNLGSVTLTRVPAEDGGKTGTMAQGYETFVVTGKVVIHRNPCLDPGDMRIVTAVDRPQLRYWKNVLLLPAADHCQRSLSAECSGGDLDGDTFSTIWHPKLVPPNGLQFDAVDYEAVAEKAKASRSADGDFTKYCGDPAAAEPTHRREEIAGFIARTMCNACLGRIAHLHLALCDQLRGRGAGAPLARLVAEAQSLAVDYPKTGIPPDVPEEARKLVRQRGYPHFMEKADRDQYDSIETLGTLYNVSSTVTCMAEFTSSDAAFSSDTAFAYPGQEEYRSDAERIYAAFAKEMQGLMLQYKLHSEAEVVLGVPYQWAEEFTLDHLSAASSLAASWKRLRSHYRALFYNALPVGDPESALKRAAAWYHVAYADKDSLHSFAWLVHEDLLKVRSGNATVTAAVDTAMLSLGVWAVHPSVAASVGASAKRFWARNADDMLRYVQLKRAVFQRVRAAIVGSKELHVTGMSGAVRVELYGSVSMLLCEAHSDLDISVSLPDFGEQYLLQDIVAPAVGTIAEQVRYIKAAKPSLVKLRVEDDYEGTDVDITGQNSDGVHKSRLVRHFYTQSGASTVLFSSIVQWARCCGLLRGETTASQPGLLNSGQVQALVVNFLAATNTVKVPSEEALLANAASDGDLVRAARHGSELDIGRLLLQFFSFYRTYGAEVPASSAATTVTGSPSVTMNGAPSEVTFRYRWPVPGNPEHSIDATAFAELRDCCRRALHVLARSRDWNYLLEHARAFEKARTRLELTLSTQTSRAIRQSYLFIAANLAIETKARVSIVPSPADTTRLHVSATGRPQQILALRRVIARLIYHGRIVSFGAIRSLSSAYFMENSSLICARGVETKNGKLHIAPVHLDRTFVRVQHAFTEMSTLSLDDAYRCDEKTWKAGFFAAMRDRVKQQVAQITSLRSGDRLQFSVHLGKFLLLDAARSFERARDAISCGEIETAINNNRGTAKFDLYDTDSSSSAGAATSREGSSATKRPEGGSRKQQALPAASNKSRKRSLATTFVSSLPLQSSVAQQGAADNALGLTIQDAEDKLTAVLTGLGYTHHDIQPDPAAASGAVPVPSSSTLQIPTNTWRVAVELSQSKQMHVDIDSGGRVLEVEERLVSWVSGTLLAAAAPTKRSQEPATDEQVQEQSQHPEGWGTYDFREHDLRFKLGTTRVISATRDRELYDRVCAEGLAPVQFQTPDAAPLHPDVSVNSQLPSAIAQREHVSAMDTPVVVAPNPLLQRGEVSFARRVVKRRAFSCPSVVKEVGESHTKDATEQGAGCPVPIYAMVAVGQHYDGSKLEVLNPFVDVSLEIDVSPLRRFIRGTGRLSGEDRQESEGESVHGEQTDFSVSGQGETGDVPNTASGSEDCASLGDSETLDVYIDNVLSEVLRVSDAIRATW